MPFWIACRFESRERKLPRFEILSGHEPVFLCLQIIHKWESLTPPSGQSSRHYQPTYRVSFRHVALARSMLDRLSCSACRSSSRVSAGASRAITTHSDGTTTPGRRRQDDDAGTPTDDSSSENPLPGELSDHDPSGEVEEAILEVEVGQLSDIDGHPLEAGSTQARRVRV